MYLISVLTVSLGIYTTLCSAVLLPEAQQLALEISEQMLPPKKLTKMIDEHLRAIRKLYPDMEEITHRPKWEPGALIIAPQSDNVFRVINESRYGPLKSSDFLYKTTENSDVYKIEFNKPYHPGRLAERLTSDVGIQDEAHANMNTGDGDDISYHASAPTYYTYTFKMGWGDCLSGCMFNHYWLYTVAPSQETLTVKLDKEYGSDLSLRKSAEKTN